MIAADLRNYPEKRNIREMSVRYTVNGKCVSPGEQTVLLTNSLGKYLRSGTK